MAIDGGVVTGRMVLNEIKDVMEEIHRKRLFRAGHSFLHKC